MSNALQDSGVEDMSKVIMQNIQYDESGNSEEKNTFKFTNKVVQSNALARAASGMNLIPLKIFKAAISCIDTNTPPDKMGDNTVYIEKADIIKLGGSKASHNYTYFKEQLFLLKQQSVLIYDSQEKVSRILSPIRQVFWSEESPVIGIQFEELLMPQLIGLSRRFTQYNISNLIGVKSKYTINLYESLLSRAREFGIKVITIPIDELRLELGSTVVNPINKKKKVLYAAYPDFEKRAVKTAVNEINTMIYFEFFIIEYAPNKKGRTYQSITFKLRKRTSITDTIDHIAFPERLKGKI